MADLSQIVRKWGGCWSLGLLILLVVYPDVVRAQDASMPTRQPPLQRRSMRSPAGLTAVSLRDNVLTINAQNQDLHEILNDIARQGDIKISQLDGLPTKPLSLRFANLPVVTGLKRLFRAAEIESYVLETEAQGEVLRVQRIRFFPPSDDRSRRQPSRRISRRPAPRATPPTPSQASEDREGGDESHGESDSGSVFDELKTNTAARRLLSQLVHPNEQVRERALERLVRLVDSDTKRAELYEFLEPLMEDLASEDRAEREEARQEVRKLLRR